MSQSQLNNDRTIIDAELTDKIRTGDTAAFEKLFNYYCQMLINFARRYVWDKQIAENIVQDIFVRVWNNRTKLDSTKSIKSYLFISVKNESLKNLRHLNVEEQGIKVLVNTISTETNPDQKYDQNEFHTEVENAINELPEKCREIFCLSRFDNLKYVEIADLLDISIKTVETQMGRALKKLRERLKPLVMILLAVTSLLYFYL